MQKSRVLNILSQEIYSNAKWSILIFLMEDGE